MASFVRQLNMYGFHKVIALHSGNLKVRLAVRPLHLHVEILLYVNGFIVTLALICMWMIAFLYSWLRIKTFNCSDLLYTFTLNSHIWNKYMYTTYMLYTTYTTSNHHFICRMRRKKLSLLTFTSSAARNICWSRSKGNLPPTPSHRPRLSRV